MCAGKAWCGRWSSPASTAAPPSKLRLGALGLSPAQVYRLIATFRENPVTGSLVVMRPGPKQGARLLTCDVEQRIEQANNDNYMSRERPSMAKLRRDLRKDCTAAGLQPPSRTAIQARVSARSLREMVKAREGSPAARQRFVPVRPGLRPRSPLDIVQIDHTKVDIQLVDDRGTRRSRQRPWSSHCCSTYSRDPFLASICRSTHPLPPASRWRSLKAIL